MARPSQPFMEEARSLERQYLESEDPIVQSGFSGGRDRWVAERSPLVEGIDKSGSFLDVGCAVGLLAYDVVAWASQRGFTIEPHGIDIGSRLIELAKSRMPTNAQNFSAADAWLWEPARQWTFVYSLLDLSPAHLLADWLKRLATWVEPGGRLIVGSYGSRSQGIDPVDVSAVMSSAGFRVVGSKAGGNPAISRFAWTEISQIH